MAEAREVEFFFEDEVGMASEVVQYRSWFGKGATDEAAEEAEYRAYADADYLRIRPRPRRNGVSTLTFMRQIRLAYPRHIRLYWIQDGLSSDWTPAIRTFAEANNIELVPTPTYASYLNRIEATSGAIDEFVCKNTDYLDWDAFGHALPVHVRHRNSPAERERRKLEAAIRRDRRATKTNTTHTLAA